ncbi:GNAT family N-acetyltransferase [Kitasatospora sp. NPDC054768]
MGGHEAPTTERLSLLRPAEGDIDAVLAVHRDPATCVHNPSDALGTRTEAEELYGRWNAVRERHGFGYWTVREHDSPAVPGFCGIKPMTLAGLPILNLFYRLAPAAWGRGVATEAATTVAAWASSHAPDLPLIARVRPENLASRRVALRAGLRRAEHLDGEGCRGFDLIFASRLP